LTNGRFAQPLPVTINEMIFDYDHIWRDREDEGILVVPKAGEYLFRLRV